MNAFDTALAAGMYSVRQIKGNSITYLRGDASTATIQAGLGESQFELENSDGTIETFTTRDYFILATDLKTASGEIWIPKKGDTVSETVNGVPMTFEVVAPGNEPVYLTFADNNEYRVHTKRIS